jgi:L-asparaginase
VLANLVVCFLGLRPLNELADPRRGGVAPFGETIWLTDFSNDGATVDAIAAGFPPGPDPRPAIRRLLEQSGGQPLVTIGLASRAADAGLTTARQVDRLVKTYLEEQRARPSGTFLQVQNYLVAQRVDGTAAVSTYRNLLAGLEAARDPEAPGAELLRRSGLVRSRGSQLEVKSPIHRQHFDDKWAARTLGEISRYLQNLMRGAAQAARLAKHREAGAKICVINTGGTVGMVQIEGEVVAPRNPEEFMEHFGEIEEVAQVDFVPLFNRDSINVYPSDWTTIARAIYERRHDGYTGFVVAHGTDTMAYSASAVAFALGEQLRFPVVFTGAQTTPDVRHGDARVNLYRACLVAMEDMPEVVICFGNYVFRGCRAQKKDERKFDAFESPSYPPLAHITEGVDVQRRLVRSVQIDDSKLRTVPETLGDIDLKASFASGVLQIGLYPGLDPEFYEGLLDRCGPDGDGRMQGVILQTLGAGNVPSVSPYSFVGFIDKATRLGIPVVVASPFPVYGSASDPRFAPAKAPIEKGAITVGNMTTAATVTKFQWVLAQVTEKERSGELQGAEARRKGVEKMMNTSYIGEVDLDPTELMV